MGIKKLTIKEWTIRVHLGGSMFHATHQDGTMVWGVKDKPKVNSPDALARFTQDMGDLWLDIWDEDLLDV